MTSEAIDPKENPHTPWRKIIVSELPTLSGNPYTDPRFESWSMGALGLLQCALVVKQKGREPFAHLLEEAAQFERYARTQRPGQIELFYI
jgi:hypothetical protein